MHRLRSTWAALIGGAFLVTLSVSAAFGAPPTGEDAPRGQTVAGFVHQLVLGPAEEPEEEQLLEEQEQELEGEGDEEELAAELVLEDELVVDGEVASAHGECVSDEASDKTDEDVETDGNHGAVVSFAAQETCWDTEDEVEADPEELEREVPEEFANHGECVSEAAQDHESVGATEAMTHGKWVSDHARYICWGLEVPTGDVTEESTLEGDEGDEADAAELTVQEERKSELAAARAERKAAQEAAVAERKAAHEAAVAQRKADHAASQGARPANAGNGGGNGRGGGRP